MKVAVLHDLITKRRADEVVIVSAGPSLNQLDKKKLQKFCEGKFTIAVKQAINLLESCDLHVINDDNFESYDYGKFQARPKIVY
ncbi:MAG: hypothetical protein O3C54_06575, partial [Proteobacteria bacterium]|nr:hypothetical protein [Pseudomonadota bacterium]